MDKPRCPIDGAPMHRDERPVTLSYRGLEETVILPGWYCSECGESVHNGEEMKNKWPFGVSMDLLRSVSAESDHTKRVNSPRVRAPRTFATGPSQG